MTRLYGLPVLLVLLTACQDVVLGDRVDDNKIAQIEVRNPGLISYDVWLVIRNEQLELQSEYLLLTGLDNRQDALTFVRHIGWDSERIVVTVVLNDRLGEHEFTMTDGSKISVQIAQ